MYDYMDEKHYDNKYNIFQNVRYVETEHNPGLNSYSLLFTTQDGIVYFSGDTKEMNTIMELINSREKIDKLYMDITTDNYPGNVHLYIVLI